VTTLKTFENNKPLLFGGRIAESHILSLLLAAVPSSISNEIIKTKRAILVMMIKGNKVN